MPTRSINNISLYQYQIYLPSEQEPKAENQRDVLGLKLGDE
jgi:hypothetical protein